MARTIKFTGVDLIVRTENSEGEGSDAVAATLANAAPGLMVKVGGWYGEAWVVLSADFTNADADITDDDTDGPASPAATTAATNAEQG